MLHLSLHSVEELLRQFCLIADQGTEQSSGNSEADPYMGVFTFQDIVKSLHHHKAQASLVGIPAFLIGHRKEFQAAVILSLFTQLVELVPSLLDQKNLMGNHVRPALGDLTKSDPRRKLSRLATCRHTNHSCLLIHLFLTSP